MSNVLNMNNDKNDTIDLRMTVLKDFKCVDNCWNQPKRVDLVKGEVIRYMGGNSRSGTVSFIREKDADRLHLDHTVAVESRHPYCSGLIDTEYLKPLDWPTELLEIVTE